MNGGHEAGGRRGEWVIGVMGVDGVGADARGRGDVKRPETELPTPKPGPPPCPSFSRQFGHFHPFHTRRIDLLTASTHCCLAHRVRGEGEGEGGKEGLNSTHTGPIRDHH